MESVLIDQSSVNPTKGVVVNNSSSNGGFRTRSHRSFYSSSNSSVSRLLLNLNARTGDSTASFGLFGSRPPPPRHSSLPSFSAVPFVVPPPPPFPAPAPAPPPLHQPPLLPLPFTKSVTLSSPTPTKRIAAVTTVRSRDHRKKTRPATNPPRKEARSPAAAVAPFDPPKGESVSAVPRNPAQKPAAPSTAVEWEEEVEEGEEEREGGFSTESVYLLSPPPSSLPLPTFFLKRPKAAASAVSCIAEAMGCGGGGGGGGNSGATDDLRRLLRL